MDFLSFTNTNKGRSLVLLGLGLSLLCCNYPSQTSTIDYEKMADDKAQYGDTLMVDSSHWLVSHAVSVGPKIAPTYRAADCTQFMEKLLSPFVDFSKEELDGLYIRKVPISKIRKDIKASKRSYAASGVVGILVNKGLADPVPAEQLQAGDVIQYWYSYELTPIDETPLGRIFGHTGIVSSKKVVDRTIMVMSSGRTDNGFSNRTFELDWAYQIYVCRLKQPLPKSE